MSKIRNFAILGILCCSCVKQPVNVKYTKLEIPKIEVYEIKFDFEKINFTNLTEENKKEVVKLINNIYQFRLKYNELIGQYKIDAEYCNSVIDAFNNENK